MIVVTTERETVLLPSAVTAEAELNDLAGRLRAAVDRRADCRDAAEKLHALRVGPAERQLAASGQVDIARLAILACGGLGNLPFAALVRPADG